MNGLNDNNKYNTYCVKLLYELIQAVISQHKGWWSSRHFGNVIELS